MTDMASTNSECQMIREHIFAYLVDQLSAEARARYTTHVRACAECQAYVAFMDHAVHLECRELVELVTAYLDGALAPADRARFEAHLELCDGCVNYLDQMRETVRLTGCLTEESLQPTAKAALLDVFRDWKRGTSQPT